MVKSQLVKSKEEMRKLGQNFAREMLAKKPGKTAVVLGLRGDLGAGKTTFLQGFAKGLGITETVNSPTFVIMKSFRFQASGFRMFYHIDCYRLEKPEEILELGFQEIISNPENIVAIEWPERIESLLPQNTISLKFEHISEGERKATIDFF